jgi:hypothetical protein
MTDAHYVNYIRARISNNSPELAKIRGDRRRERSAKLDGTRTLGKRILLNKLRGDIVFIASQDVRTVEGDILLD